jgi:hypothetical protein
MRFDIHALRDRIFGASGDRARPASPVLSRQRDRSSPNRDYGIGPIIKPPEICIDLRQPEIGCPRLDRAQRLIPELGYIVEDRVISRMLVFAYCIRTALI